MRSVGRPKHCEGCGAAVNTFGTCPMGCEPCTNGTMGCDGKECGECRSERLAAACDALDDLRGE